MGQYLRLYSISNGSVALSTANTPVLRHATNE